MRKERATHPIRESLSLRGPRIIYDHNLLAPNVPYTVDVNGESLALLLQTFGMPDEKIAELTVHVKRGEKLADVFRGKGVYSRTDDTITINTEWAWRQYQQYCQAVARIAEDGEVQIGDTARVQKLLYTRRLPDYLASVPTERGVAFAYRIGAKAIDRELNSTLLHEARHAIDRDNALQRFSAIALEAALRLNGSMLVLGGSYAVVGDTSSLGLECLRLGAAYFIWQPIASVLNYQVIDPVERSARKFASQRKNDPEWRSIVTIREK